MVDIAFFIILHIFFFLLGLPFVKLLPKTWSWRISCLSGILGIALASFAVNILYSLNLSTLTIFYIFLIYAAVSLVLTIYNQQFNILSFLKSEKTLLFAWIFCSLLLILPRLIGGTRFSIFQGNQGDTFLYWEAALNYVQETYNQILALQPNDFAQFPFRQMGQKMLIIRPAVHLLFAFTTRFFPSKMPELNYTFLVFFFSQAFLGLCFFLRNLFSATKLQSIGISLAFVVGFFGQYILDINAWSQIASLPLEITLLVLFIFTILNCNRNNLLILGLLLISFLYVYAELYLFYIPALFIVLLVARYYKLVSNKQVALISSVVLISLFSGFLYYRGIIGFLIREVNVSFFDKRSSCWTYFQKYLFGQDDVGIQLKSAAESILGNFYTSSKSEAVTSVNWIVFLKQFLLDYGNASIAFLLIGNVFLGLIGLYFITPVAGIPQSLALVQMIFLLVSCVAILVGSVIVMWKQLKQRNMSLLLYISFTIVIFSQTLLLLLQHKFWEFGKSYSYISPFILIIICMLAIFKTKHVLLRNLANIFIIIQICFGIYRICAVAHPNNGIHYVSPPYPSVQSDARNAKENYDWNFDSIMKNASSCRLVLVDIDDVWVRRYLHGVLYNQKTQILINPLNDSPDCIIKEKTEKNVKTIYLDKR